MSDSGFGFRHVRAPQVAAQESAEAAYRRGYRDGFLAACDTLHGLMFKERRSRLAAYEEAWAFAQDELTEWTERQLDTRLLPPDLPARWK